MTMVAGATALDASVGAQEHSVARVLRQLLALTAAIDIAVMALSARLAWSLSERFDIWLVPPNVSARTTAWAGALIVLSWLMMLAAEGGYSLRYFGSGAQEFRVLARASLFTTGLVAMACWLLQPPVTRGFVVLTFLVGTPLLLLERYAFRKVVHRARHRGHLLHRVVAVGGVSGISEVLSALRRAQYVGYQIVGACTPGDLADADQFGVPVSERVQDTLQMCRRLGADTVLVARGGFESSQELRQMAWDLEGSHIELVVVPSLTDVAGPRIHLRPVAGLPLLHLEQPQAGAAGGMTKRAFDVVVASLALLLLAPLLLAVAVVVKLQDGGPVLFRQARVGRSGEPFAMIKFRSMVIDAEDRLADLMRLNESDGLLFKIKQDPRITRVGRFMRRYSIDELPQLLNVLRGEMSLVGPRPPLPSEVDHYAVDVHRRLLVRPGLTGLWQVSGRSAISWEESIRLDLYYVDNWSMSSDLVIIAKTVRAVLGASGAY